MPFVAVVAGLSMLAGAEIWHVASMIEGMWAAPPIEVASVPVEPVYQTAPPVLEAQQPVADNVYYSGCREVRAAGATPQRRGSPGYRPEMDGDGDGIACEDY